MAPTALNEFTSILYPLWIKCLWIFGKDCDRIEKGRCERPEDKPEQLQPEVNACKLEGESVSILIRSMDSLEARIDGCESRITKWERNQDKNSSLV